MPGPWRTVTNIQNIYRINRFGKESLTFKLTLECGHKTSKRMGCFEPARDIFKPIRTAPKKIRCILCFIREENNH